MPPREEERVRKGPIREDTGDRRCSVLPGNTSERRGADATTARDLNSRDRLAIHSDNPPHSCFRILPDGSGSSRKLIADRDSNRPTSDGRGLLPTKQQRCSQITLASRLAHSAPIRRFGVQIPVWTDCVFSWCKNPALNIRDR